MKLLDSNIITINEEIYCDYVFKILQTFPIDNAVLSKAIELRKTYKMKLGDSIIAATALLANIEIYTRNLDDFIKIPDLVVVNPIVE